MAVSLSFGPHAFGFHGWPKAPAPRSIERVVRIAPKDAPIAIARREPAKRWGPEHDSAAADRGAQSAPARKRPTERAALTPRRSARHRSGGRWSGSSPDPVESPAPPRGGHDDPAEQAPDGTPVAQAPSPLPQTAEAKPQVAPPRTTVDVELELDGGRGEGHAHGHGRHRWH
jgi:hypothetical protein